MSDPQAPRPPLPPPTLRLPPGATTPPDERALLLRRAYRASVWGLLVLPGLASAWSLWLLLRYLRSPVKSTEAVWTPKVGLTLVFVAFGFWSILLLMQSVEFLGELLKQLP